MPYLHVSTDKTHLEIDVSKYIDVLVLSTHASSESNFEIRGTRDDDSPVHWVVWTPLLGDCRLSISLRAEGDDMPPLGESDDDNDDDGADEVRQSDCSAEHVCLEVVRNDESPCRIDVAHHGFVSFGAAFHAVDEIYLLHLSAADSERRWMCDADGVSQLAVGDSINLRIVDLPPIGDGLCQREIEATRQEQAQRG